MACAVVNGMSYGPRRAPAAGQHAEHVIQALTEGLDGECLQPRGCQFQRQGDAIQTAADLRDRCCVLGRQGEVGLRRRGPLHEETDGLVLQEG